MVFPSDLGNVLFDEPQPSEDAPPLSDGSDTPTDSGDTGSNGGDTSLPEPESDPNAPPLSNGGDGGQDLPVEGPPIPPDLVLPGDNVDQNPPIGTPEEPPVEGEPLPPSGTPSTGGPGGTTQPIPQPSTEPPPPPNVSLPGLQGVLDWLHNAISDVETQLQGITSGIGGEIGGLIDSLIPPEIAAITGLAAIIGNLVEGLLNNLAPVADIGQMAQDALTGGIPLAIQSFVDNAWEQRGDSISQMLEEIVNNDQLPDNIKAPFAAIHSGTSPIEKILGIFGMAGLLATVGHTLLSPILEKARIGANAVFRPAVPSIDQGLDMLTRGIISLDDYGRIVGSNGLPDDWGDALRFTTKPRFSPDVLNDLLNRGEIDQSQWTNALAELGHTSEQAGQLDRLRMQVPNYTDLVHFMTRDAFWDNPDSPFGDIVHEFNLDYGEDQLPYDQFAIAGVPAYMARWAWRSHWEIPGRHDANEMFFRGTLGDRSAGGDGEAVLRRVYRARGIEPRFIEPLIATAFHPIGRIDIRRLIRSGTMDRDGAIEAYQQIGYNADNAALLADLAITLATQESASEKEPFRSGLKTRIVAAYINGTLDENDANSALTELAYDAEKIAQFLSEAEVERAAQLADHIRQGTQRLYTSGEWDQDTTAGYLQSKGFSDAEIGRLFEWWEPLRELSDLKAEHKQHKEATRADVLTAYRDDIIDTNSVHDHLSAIGYNDDDIAMFISSADHAKTRADISAEIEGIHAAFTDRQIDIQEAVHELDATGINGSRRNSLLRKWQAELDRKLPDIPLTMVEKLALAKLYTFDELTQELHKRHFDEAQIDKFRTLWGYEIQVISERAKTQSQREAEAIQRRNEADQRRKEAEQRREAAHTEAEQRHAEVEARRAISEQRRAEADARRAARESQAEHDRMVRDARQGRLSIGRIRTAYTLGIISADQLTQLMEAIGLRPETAAMELTILNEQARAKQLTQGGQSGSNSGQQITATTTI